MFQSNSIRSLNSVKFKPFTLNVLRKFSDQPLIISKENKTSLKVEKKPSRPPFMKNIFLGKFDMEMLVYPELDKPRHEELKSKVRPLKEFFKDSVDSKVISSLKSIPSEIKENLKNLGLFGQIIPSEYGGNDQTAVETAFISEIIGKDLDVAVTLYSHNFLAVQSLVMYGSQAQKEKYLPLLASGELTSAFCLSENVSSSDLPSLLTTALPSEDKPDFFIINGKKQWVINGNVANLLIVLVKTNFRTHTAEIVPMVRLMLVERDFPGITTKTMDHNGLNASNICEVHFNNTPVNANCFIGGETQGFEICTNILNSGRYNIGAITISFLKNLLVIASDFIVSRKQYERQLIDCELLQGKVADVALCIYILESMTYHTAALLDTYDNPDCSLELAIIKVFSFTEGRRCLDLIMELMGGRAYLNSEIVQKHFRDFRAMEMFDGTIDIANLFISLVGLQYAGITRNETIKKLRFTFEYPNFAIQHAFKTRRQYSDNPKLTLKLFEQLHPSLKESANNLEYCVLRFDFAVSTLFQRYGSDVIDQQLELMRLSDAAVKIYAMTTVLARSSRSYCIGLQNAETELKYAIQICSKYRKIIQDELNEVIAGLVISGDIYSIKFGPDVFRHHGYFLQHPLERSY